MPKFDEKEFIECLKQYINLEKRWIPDEKGFSLYIRPTAIGTEPSLGVHPSSTVKLYIVACTVGP